jgi:hypothetical protein
MCERKITGSAVSQRKQPSSTTKNFWIWGIMIVQTFTLDRRYFFLIIDDYNRHTVIYLLEKKNYILGCNKKYTPTVENEFGRKPKIKLFILTEEVLFLTERLQTKKPFAHESLKV